MRTESHRQCALTRLKPPDRTLVSYFAIIVRKIVLEIAVRSAACLDGCGKLKRKSGIWFLDPSVVQNPRLFCYGGA